MRKALVKALDLATAVGRNCDEARLHVLVRAVLYPERAEALSSGLRPLTLDEARLLKAVAPGEDFTLKERYSIAEELDPSHVHRFARGRYANRRP